MKYLITILLLLLISCTPPTEPKETHILQVSGYMYDFTIDEVISSSTISVNDEYNFVGSIKHPPSFIGEFQFINDDTLELILIIDHNPK